MSNITTLNNILANAAKYQEQASMVVSGLQEMIEATTKQDALLVKSQAEITTLSAELNKVTKQRDELLAETERTIPEMAAALAENKRLMEQVYELRSSLDEFIDVDRSITRKDNEIEKLKEDLKNSMNDKRDTERELEVLRNEMTAMRNELNVTRTRATTDEAKIRRKLEAIKRLCVTIDENDNIGITIGEIDTLKTPTPTVGMEDASTQVENIVEDDDSSDDDEEDEPEVIDLTNSKVIDDVVDDWNDDCKTPPIDLCVSGQCDLNMSENVILDHLESKHKHPSFKHVDGNIGSYDKDDCFYATIAYLLPYLGDSNQVKEKMTDMLASSMSIDGKPDIAAAKAAMHGGFPFTAISQFAKSYNLTIVMCITKPNLDQFFCSYGCGETTIYIRYVVNVHYHAVIPEKTQPKKFLTFSPRCQGCNMRDPTIRYPTATGCNNQWCGEDTPAVEYDPHDMNRKPNCSICKSWVPFGDERAAKCYNPAAVDNSVTALPGFDSLYGDGLEFFATNKADSAHICGHPWGNWIYDGVVMVPKGGRPAIDLSMIKSRKAQSLPNPDEVSESTDEAETLLEEELPSNFPDAAIHDRIKDSPDLLKISSNQVDSVAQGRFEDTTFFSRSLNGKNTVNIGQHKTHANDYTVINPITVFDSLALDEWNSVNIRSGLEKDTISFGVTLREKVLDITHLGLYMMFAQRGNETDQTIVVTKEDAENTEFDSEDIVNLIAWSAYAWQSCIISKAHLETIITGPFSNPRWCIGKVKDLRASSYVITATKASLFTVDPVLAAITSLTLTVQLTVSSRQKKSDPSAVTSEMTAMCQAAKISLEHSTITQIEKNTVSLTVVAPSAQSPHSCLRPYVKSITVVNGTNGDKSYASYGQIVRSTLPNTYHISGVFSYIYTNGVSSKPCDVYQADYSALMRRISHSWIERYLKHLSDMKARLTGGVIDYEIKRGKVQVRGKEVDTLLNLHSRSLCGEFALSKNAIYHPDNKNICAKCNIVYADAVSCGYH